MHNIHYVVRKNGINRQQTQHIEDTHKMLMKLTPDEAADIITFCLIVSQRELTKGKFSKEIYYYRDNI